MFTRSSPVAFEGDIFRGSGAIRIVIFHSSGTTVALMRRVPRRICKMLPG